MDTIYALSSGAVPSGVAVIRISGPRTEDALLALTPTLPEPRAAVLRTLRKPDHSIIDQALVLWFPAPRSETGEDMAELHVHGGRAVVQAIFSIFSARLLRMAEPGEFIRRAFDNGKLDLTEVEGLADLIAAETEVQRRQAVGQAAGALARRAERWRETLIDLRAEIEARLDFSDEGDVPDALAPDFWMRVRELSSEIEEAIGTAAAAERVREGFRVAILGPPNAGKSSLLNALSRREIAIVTDEPGTTRDVLEVPLDLHGYPVVLFDTAGLRESESRAETEGVRRARRTAADADLLLWLSDCEAPAAPPPDLPERPLLRLSTKIDLAPAAPGSDLGISLITRSGLIELIEKLTQSAADSLGSGNAVVTRQRQKEALLQAADALDKAQGKADEVAADLLRAASDAIGRLSGRIDVEDVLDRLFSEFCIGK
jgi:tRNA modification GTPase